ncbi:hypothetical protein VP01_9556g1 [Puccinia sorghi]|uniref:Uncharacterized protein n=1 Tax=Puccinia sorghi TaxID=27349 RepID=A0A0L6U6A2_9BASI|nr:hypothetical protein VP01_9556g1 [Puccinia sorghi]
MRDQEDLNIDILITLKSLQGSQKTSTDFILSSLKQDAITKREEIIKSIKEIKEISMKADLEHLKKRKENTHHNYGRTEDTETKENPPHISNKTPLYNNPYMQEENKNNKSADLDRDGTPNSTMDISAINKLNPPIKDY